MERRERKSSLLITAFLYKGETREFHSRVFEMLADDILHNAVANRRPTYLGH